ncbi:hypothetical protein NL676_010121 [Syzygium grande]|nr:hypothetical protein NL676_010121 [Syzygium grande]
MVALGLASVPRGCSRFGGGVQLGGARCWLLNTIPCYDWHCRLVAATMARSGGMWLREGIAGTPWESGKLTRWQRW